MLFYNEKEYEYQLPISELVKLKPIKLYKENAFVENAFIADKALIMCVSEIGKKLDTNYDNSLSDLSKLLVQKQQKSKAVKVSKPHLTNNPFSEMEIDLHIEELRDNFSGMSNFEIVTVQLNKFKNALDTAQNGQYKKLIVIHGVGNGRLKQEISNILTKETKFRFHDASYAKYGFGATEIMIS